MVFPVYSANFQVISRMALPGTWPSNRMGVLKVGEIGKVLKKRGK